MITAVCVELRRLLPEFVGELIPAQTSVSTTGIERCTERCEVEDG
jgi:hypothetical protein